MLIGVVYLAPSLGYKDYPGSEKVIEMAIQDTKIYFEAGVDAVLLENENDHPYTLTATSQVIASMTATTLAVVKAFPKKNIGVEFLLNDPKASLAIAAASGAQFIRTDYFVDRMSRPEYGGDMHIDPQAVMDYRKQLKAESIKIYSDIQVKYATMLEQKSLAESARQAEHYGSDGAVVSGTKTGVAPSAEELKSARSGGKNISIMIGSGLNVENIPLLKPYLDGAIVGTSMMIDGRPDLKKATQLVQAWKNTKSKSAN